MELAAKPGLGIIHLGRCDFARSTLLVFFCSEYEKEPTSTVKQTHHITDLDKPKRNMSLLDKVGDLKLYIGGFVPSPVLQ